MSTSKVNGVNHQILNVRSDMVVVFFDRVSPARVRPAMFWSLVPLDALSSDPFWVLSVEPGDFFEVFRAIRRF